MVWMTSSQQETTIRRRSALYGNLALSSSHSRTQSFHLRGGVDLGQIMLKLELIPHPCTSFPSLIPRWLAQEWPRSISQGRLFIACVVAQESI